MILKTKYLAILTLIVCSLFCGLGAKAAAFDILGTNCSGKAASSAVCQDNSAASGDNSTHNVVLRTIKAASNIIAFLSGAVAVIIIIISGLTLVISGGNSEQVANARRRIIYAAVGLAVIALAWTIISFVIKNVL
jgi:hypothetical protein